MIKKILIILKNPKLLFLFALGLSSGLPLALTAGTLQAWMNDEGIDIKTIGLFGILGLPYTLKFLWAPLLDRYKLPFLDRRKGWAILTQILLALIFILISMTNPKEQISYLMVLCLLSNFLSATQDLVLDAYRREILPDNELGIGAATFVNGYLISFRFISGALAILLSTLMTWNLVYMIMAGFMLLMVAVTFAAPQPKNYHQPKSLKAAFLDPLKEYFSRDGAVIILFFILLYKLGDNLASSITVPFILQSGYSKEEYVAISKVWGLIATILGTTIGGIYLNIMGTYRTLFIMGIFQALSTAGFAILPYVGKNNLVLSFVIGFENLTAGMGTAAFAAYLASMSHVSFTATQYALLSSLMRVPSIIFSSRTGAMAETMGWTNFFLFCSIIAIPGLVLILAINSKDRMKKLKIPAITICVITSLFIVIALAQTFIDILKI
jgi:PAT family beta-lactamase induction signal transducer AmpG